MSEPVRRFADGPNYSDPARWSPAGADGARAFELLAEARAQVVGTVAGAAERAVTRLLAGGRPLNAQEMFDDAELDEVSEALARLIALGDLTGRARVRLRADAAERSAPRALATFAEWAGPFKGDRGGEYWIPKGADDRPENRRYDKPGPDTPAQGLPAEAPGAGPDAAAGEDRTGIAPARRAELEARAAQIAVTRRLIDEDDPNPPEGFWGQGDDTFPVMWFRTSTGNRYKIEVAPADEPFRAAELIFSDGAGKIGVTGAGGAAEVFTTVLAASTALLRAKKPRVVIFSAAGEGAADDARGTGRQRLYERLAKGVAAMNGEYTAVAFPGENPSKTSYYAVVRRELLQQVLDSARANTGKVGKVLLFADAGGALWAAAGDWLQPLHAFADLDGDGIDDLFEPLRAEPLTALPPRAALEYFRSKVAGLKSSPVAFGPALDRYAFTLAVSTEQSVLERVKAAILKGLEDGGRPTFDVQSILDAAGVSPRNPQYAEMVVRTNLNDAYNRGAEAELAEGDMRERFPVWEYLGILDDRTGDDHRPKIGKYFPAAASFAEVRGDRVYNCVLPGQYVQGRVLRALKADYAGEIVEIRTAQGRRLSLTVNHPVLTPAGFLAAGELKKGCHLVCHEARNQIAVLGEHDQYPPTKIEQVFEALAVRFGRARAAEVSALDLHGDSQFVVGQIEVVGADRELREQVYAARPEFRIEAALAGADVSAARVPGARPLLPNGERIDRASARGLGLCDGGGTGGGRGLGALGIGPAAHLDVPRGQPTQDGWATDPELTGKLVRGSAGAVLLDQIVHVERRQFAGHVYDLETEVGYYVVGAEPNQGTIVSNCRCSFRPVSRFLSDGLPVETEW